MPLLEQFLIALLALCLTLAVYHHALYPLLLEWLGARALKHRADPPPASPPNLPTVAVIVPAHNEATVIAEKIRNLAELEYPREKLRICLIFDGCSDGTQAVAHRALADATPGLRFEIVEHATNIGKIAVLNAAVAAASEEIIALSDASAIVTAGALVRAAAHFQNPGVGAVCGTYKLVKAGSDGEDAYWHYQTRIKVLEGALAAPMGAHGAFYTIRRKLWEPLATDTINDDFFIPTRIALDGHKVVYDPEIAATELEQTTRAQEFRRRLRIGGGNMQQLLRLPGLLNPARGYLALLFVSGKGLRTLMPFILLLAGLTTLALTAFAHYPLLHSSETVAAFGIIGALALRARGQGSPRPLAWLGYLIEGHFASGLGGLAYLLRKRNAAPSGTSWADLQTITGSMPVAVYASKRLMDIVLASVALVALIVLFVPLALAIKIDSRGPVFYRQRRIGQRTATSTRYFDLIKLRTMCEDAEASTGAVWARKNDPRVTRVGWWLRKTRLDELPQCINVLRGEMSVVGPRPERPEIVEHLEEAIPYYLERTFGLKPGITGLAQINSGYDGSIDDVRKKVTFDHAYALHIMTFKDWLKTDCKILWRTLLVMARGEGQ